jgi:hypothetical protein
MDASVDRVEALVDQGLVGDRALDEVNQVGVQQMLEGLELAGAQIVEYQHAVAPSGQRIDEM